MSPSKRAPEAPAAPSSAGSAPLGGEGADEQFVALLQKALAPSYTVVKPLGAGGMASVYLARDPVLKRHVAVKVLSPALARSEDARARFQREAQAVAAISHPNVVPVFSVGQLENGTPYLVMQYVDGRAMDERVASDGPLDVEAAKRVLGEVASAIGAAHRKGIIHRDIKPANILWDDASGRAMVTDFGIAAVLEGADEQGGSAKLTQTGMSIGTPAYMSPEQVLAEPVTEKTDIYSLGLLGYELLTGDGPYDVSSPRELMAAHLRDAPRKLTALRSDCDPELERLLEACLSKDPKQRPSAEEVSSRLTHGASVLLEWPPPGLERLASKYAAMVNMLLGGALMLAAPVVVLSAFDRRGLLYFLFSQAMVTLTLSFVGLIAFGFGMLQLSRLIAEARRAVGSGFGWLTVVEAANDRRGDTGALIAGAREYAALSAAQRNTLRTRRLAAGALRLGAALTPVAGYFAGLVPAVRLAGGPGLPAVTSIALALAMLLGARVLDSLEDRSLRTARRRMHVASLARSRTDRFRLAETWTKNFESASAGQRLGTGGRRGHNVLVPAIGGVAFMVLLLVGGAMYLLAAMTTFAREQMALYPPAYRWTTETVRRAEPLRRYQLPVDSSITPLRAGQAIRAIRQSRPAAARLISMGDLDEAMRTARRGLRPELRARLEAAAQTTELGEFRLVSRAVTFDYLGAAFTPAQLDSIPLGDIPMSPRMGSQREVAKANAAAAALAFAAGRTADAELRLREIVSYGFLLIREGNWTIENTTGANIVDVAQVALGPFYQQIGRPEDAALVTAAVPASAREPMGSRAPEFSERIARTRATITNGDELRGIRMELLIFEFALAPCLDVRQIVFGAAPAHIAVLAAARQELVRFPSDSILLDKVEYALDRPLGRHGPWNRAFLPLTASIDLLTGSRRMRSCGEFFAWLLG